MLLLGAFANHIKSDKGLRILDCFGWTMLLLRAGANQVMAEAGDLLGGNIEWQWRWDWDAIFDIVPPACHHLILCHHGVCIYMVYGACIHGIVSPWYIIHGNMPPRYIYYIHGIVPPCCHPPSSILLHQVQSQSGQYRAVGMLQLRIEEVALAITHYTYSSSVTSREGQEKGIPYCSTE